MTKRNLILSLFSHFLGWLFFMSLPLMFFYEDDLGPVPILLTPAYWTFCVTFIALFYLLIRWIIPRLYLHGRKIPFAVCVLVLFGCICTLKPYDRLIRASRQITLAGNGDRMHAPAAGRDLDIVSIYLFFFVLALSMATRITTAWRSSVQRALAAEAGKANAELSLLKAQINPHFLFNTLNNLYTLVLTGHPAAADGVLKLSHIMRFITEDASRQVVPLWQEIRFTEDYIALQRLKLGAGSELDYRTDGTIDHQEIAPLILIPFIENMFKYGVSKHSWSPLLIRICAEGTRFTFRCENNIHDLRSIVPGTGIGIRNTIRRLDAVYPGRYQIDIRQTGGRYTTSLSIDLTTSSDIA